MLPMIAYNINYKPFVMTFLTPIERINLRKVLMKVRQLETSNNRSDFL